MDIKLIIVVLAAIAQLALFWSYRRKAIFPFVLALAVSFAWTAFYRYEYIGENTYLFNQINIYPLTLWTVGLTFLYLEHAYLLRRFNYFYNAILYLIGLAILEAFGYYILGIRLNSDYTSLLGLGIIHAPPYMKVFYVVAGPIFLLIAQIVRSTIRRSRKFVATAESILKKYSL